MSISLSLFLKAIMYKHIYFVIPASAPVSLYSHATSIINFNGLNFSDWCEQIWFHLGVLDLDLALLSEKPAAITSASNDDMIDLSINLGKDQIDWA